MKMKNLLMLLMLPVLIFTGCKKDRPVLDPPGSKLEGINSSWILVGVDQVDIASLQQKSLDVSEAFIGDIAMQVQFNSSDFTYSVTNGSGPNYFGNSGSWAFDDNEYPTQITLTTSTGDVKVCPLLHTIRPVDTYLQFSYARTCSNADAPYVSYNFKFARTN
ncbi:MAG: DUF5004 domain-containing protein [Bacteroidetes bacterium]|nr:DUF5004 domain-containing protein [Bacteroidota bacterium]